MVLTSSRPQPIFTKRTSNWHRAIFCSGLNGWNWWNWCESWCRLVPHSLSKEFQGGFHGDHVEISWGISWGMIGYKPTIWYMIYLGVSESGLDLGFQLLASGKMITLAKTPMIRSDISIKTEGQNQGKPRARPLPWGILIWIYHRKGQSFFLPTKSCYIYIYIFIYEII